ncbi:tetratricopeptide repeat protein [Melioribacteraceae bacterium 4301-Me]|uniref:tetratricopeptide repeat protein n=1 Tax=Pyranulibacter aquaticus TaxID=3163344 RepID=UPI00359800F3
MILKFSYKILIFFFFVIFSVSAVYSQSVEQLMKQGNDLYQKGDYEQAINMYSEILNKGYESAPLYYNLANAYFRANKLGLAILYYEKGLKLKPDDEDIQYNLKIANSRTVDKIQELPKLFFAQWWEILITSLSINALSVLLIIVFIAFLSSVAVYLLSKNFRLQRASFFSGSIILALLIIVLIVFIARINRETSSNYAVLIEPSITAKIAPDEKSSDAFLIHEGIKFQLLDHVNGWSEIKLNDGKIGWLPDNSFGKI